MSTNTLLEKIAADAAVEVEKINAEVARECDAITQESETKLAAVRSEAMADLEKQKAQQELVATSKARQEGKMAVQKAKRSHLDTLFAAVEKEMVEADAASYEAFFTTKAKQVLPSGLSDVTIAAPAKRMAETERIVEAVNVSGTVVADDSIAAGLIVTAADGVYDASFERLFNAMRPEIEMQIASEFMQ